ncbi:hypothetical protein [Acidovorax sp.]|uniref:hypothetical protein n=1 Tax=Acidovorax sp. TaxID=1872122 RepID=UPI00391EFFC4
MKLFTNRWGPTALAISIGLNIFLLASFAGGISGTMAVERILKHRVAAVTEVLSPERRQEIATHLEAALQAMKGEQDAVRLAQQQWLATFEDATLEPQQVQTRLRQQMQDIRVHREASNAVLHEQALRVIAGMNTSERQAVAAQIRKQFDVARPPEPSISNSTPVRSAP